MYISMCMQGDVLHFLQLFIYPRTFRLSHILAIANNATWSWECRCLFEILILNPLHKCPEVEQKIVLFLVFWGSFLLFSLVVPLFCALTHVCQGSRQLPWQVGGDSALWFMIYISLIISVVEHLLYTCWSFAYLWRNFYSEEALPIFDQVAFFFF